MSWDPFLAWRGPNYGIENLQQQCESLEKMQQVTDITLRTLHYECNYNILPEIKESRVALHSEWSCSCVMGRNEMEVTNFQPCFSQRGIGGTNKSVQM